MRAGAIPRKKPQGGSKNRCTGRADCGFISPVHFETPGDFCRVLSSSSTRFGMARQRLHVFYSGRVQGVGFRYTVKSLATGFEVTGTVRNLDDGRVELVAEGERAEMDAFRQAIRESGLGPCIRQEELNWSEAGGGFRGFEIVR